MFATQTRVEKTAWSLIAFTIDREGMKSFQNTGTSADKSAMMIAYFVSYRSKIVKACYVYQISGELLEFSVGHRFWGMSILECVYFDPFLGIQSEVAALQKLRKVGSL